ncbi:HAD-like protein [Cylindrobasidium torrendii FP15055 ss-10]|uniref:HAD-like protein n=1 Tax=Cylindrobasidium torrendii FP15055 ss-10 TaxID=1314674 RepID=A0A0D7BMC7_9AGAR|nr:HAD-like protein [Cylindrobasidium torrendii FP15055 ss-10]
MTTSPRLTDYKVLVFDCYGTLVDWETGIYEGLKPLLLRFPGAGWSRGEALEGLERAEKKIQAADPALLYPDVLAKSYLELENELVERFADGNTPSSSSAEDAKAFGASIKNWPLFPDTAAALRELSKTYKLCILSNVDRGSFAHTHAKLSTGDTNALASPFYSPDPAQEWWFPQRIPGADSPFSMILTAEQVKSYKPALPGFLKALEIIRDELIGGEDAVKNTMWVAQSLHHDIEPSHKLGLRSTWINRGGAAMGAEKGPPKYTWTFSSMGAFAEAVKNEKA